MKWVTRDKAKVDRIACPWLISKFVDKKPEFLFVPPEHVAAKVIAVWRAGFSERVLAYRLEHGLGIVVNPPVVLVQRMVNANIAGVAFSADPVTGRRSVAIVSALYGLGTALVSGECDADSFAVDRSGTILSPTVVEKKKAYRHLSDEVEGVQKEGGVIRSIDIAHFDDELRRIYRVVIASFRDNFLAGPIAEVDFLEQKRLLRPYVRPELVLLAECEGEPVGFAFVIPDWLQAQRGAAIDTIVVKTLAIHPAYAGKGLGTLLAGRVREIAHNLWYTRAIHAFMHERNLSRRISRAYGGQIIRHYALYSKTLEGWT